MNKIVAALPALLVVLPFVAFADHSLPEGTQMVATAHAEQACVIEHNLALGSYGTAVSCLQKHLIEDSHLKTSAPTGYFGELTKAAVVKWQKERGIASTGFFGALSRAEFSEHQEAEASMPATGVVHAHEPVNVGQWPLVPSVSMQLHPDTMSGWNLEATTTNFRFAPEHVNGAVVPNEGHMHLYVDGKKISRVYGNWYHVGKELFVGTGKHEVVVTLNANDHSDLSLNGVRVEAKAEVITQ